MEMLKLIDRKCRQVIRRSPLKNASLQPTESDTHLKQPQPSLLVPRLLSTPELAAALQQLPGWSLQDSKLHREFCFSCFEKALGFLTGLSLAGKIMGHYPKEGTIYDRVTVDLTTYEAGGVTHLDVILAEKANELAANLNS
jgi:4a-hydroxytetrahydrobiopterin dehydratase